MLGVAPFDMRARIGCIGKSALAGVPKLKPS